MQIDIPDELVDRLRRRMAPGASEADALRDVLDTVDWVEDDQPTEEELAQSLAVIDRSMEEVKAGRTMPAKEALQQIAQELGLSIQR